MSGINLSSLKKNNRITKAKKPSQKVFSSFSVLQWWETKFFPKSIPKIVPIIKTAADGCRAELMFFGKKMPENMTGILEQKRIGVQKFQGQFKVREFIFI